MAILMGVWFIEGRQKVGNRGVRGKQVIYKVVQKWISYHERKESITSHASKPSGILRQWFSPKRCPKNWCVVPRRQSHLAHGFESRGFFRDWFPKNSKVLGCLNGQGCLGIGLFGTKPPSPTMRGANPSISQPLPKARLLQSSLEGSYLICYLGASFLTNNDPVQLHSEAVADLGPWLHLNDNSDNTTLYYWSANKN